MAEKHYGYAETPWAADSYGCAVGVGIRGCQAVAVIDYQRALAAQAQAFITDYVKSVGIQGEGKIENYVKAEGTQGTFCIESSEARAYQATSVVYASSAKGYQAEGLINFLDARAFQGAFTVAALGARGHQANSVPVHFRGQAAQAELSILGTRETQAQQVKLGKLLHIKAPFYGLFSYCQEYSYCTNFTKVLQPAQAYLGISKTRGLAAQSEIHITNKEKVKANQAEAIIYGHKYTACQATCYLVHRETIGCQALAEMHKKDATGCQSLAEMHKSKAKGCEVVLAHIKSNGFQARISLYNRDNLRILYRFASRGTTGTNWTANSTATGDYSVNNLNTDIVEQYWRSVTGVKAVTLDCDTEVSQGVFVDTLAILGHNFTRSATVVLLASNAADFGGAVEFTLDVELTNMYYIAETLPIDSYRYWRLSISDSTNTDNYIKVGTVVFGAATILRGETFTDELSMGKINYTDGVNTEGFTTVKNDRALKRYLTLNFRNMSISYGNYAALQTIFDYARTTLKCLWVPRPMYPSRYALFSKMIEIPEETHNSRAENLTYVDFSIKLDESK